MHGITIGVASVQLSSTACVNQCCEVTAQDGQFVSRAASMVAFAIFAVQLLVVSSDRVPLQKIVAAGIRNLASATLLLYLVTAVLVLKGYFLHRLGCQQLHTMLGCTTCALTCSCYCCS